MVSILNVHALTQTGGESVAIMLDNFAATLSRDRGEKEPHTSHCTFVQAFNQLHSKDSAVGMNPRAHQRPVQLILHAVMDRYSEMYSAEIGFFRSIFKGRAASMRVRADV
jgi:hypothetical protein